MARRRVHDDRYHHPRRRRPPPSVRTRRWRNEPASVGRGVAHRMVAWARRPAPAALPHHPGSVMKRRKPPGCGIDPGPAPRCHPGPASIMEWRPARRHRARLPDLAVLGMCHPVAMAVEILPTAHGGRHMARRAGRIVQPLIARHPVGKYIPVNRCPGVTGHPIDGVQPQIGATPRGDRQGAVAADKTQLAAPDAGLGGRRVGLRLPVEAVVPWRCRQPAAFDRRQFDAGMAARQRIGQAQGQAAGLQPKHQALLIQALQRQFDISAQSDRAAAQVQLGSTVGSGTQAVASGQRPVAQHLLRGANPTTAVAVIPTHVARQGLQAAGKNRQLTDLGEQAARRGDQQHAEKPTPQPGRPRHGPARQSHVTDRVGKLHDQPPPLDKSGLLIQRGRSTQR